VALLDSEVNGPVNIASGRPVALRDVIEAVARHAGAPGLVRLGSRPAPENDPPLLLANIKRLRDEVGWTPRYDLEGGIEHTVNWWRERLDEDQR